MAFFATPTRAWEFALGGLVALAPGARRGSDTRGRTAAAWTGIALVVAADAFITRHDAFPGWIAAVPTVGAACVIAARAPRTRTAPTFVLGTRPVQWIGDNSYSIYLWHWPLIIALPWLVHGQLKTPLRFGVIPAT